jgi:DNA-binding NtrC family response regulator
MADVLLIENDARILELYAAYLTKRGHRVRTAKSFREAREMLVAEPPEILLTDLELGVESGRDVLPQLWSEGLLPPTLVVSGYVDAELQAELERIPAVVGMLPKPFGFERLEESLLAALARASERRSARTLEERA